MSRVPSFDPISGKPVYDPHTGKPAFCGFHCTIPFEDWPEYITVIVNFDDGPVMFPCDGWAGAHTMTKTIITPDDILAYVFDDVDTNADGDGPFDCPLTIIVACDKQVDMSFAWGCEIQVGTSNPSNVLLTLPGIYSFPGDGDEWHGTLEIVVDRLRV